MVAGQLSNNKVGFIIQARMQSNRLPGKVLMPLPFPDGEPLLGVILDQLVGSFGGGSIVVASSVNTENNKIAELCDKKSIVCHRGSEDDVLSRFVDIQKQYQFDYIVRLTSDNPILDVSILNNCLEWHIAKDLDYSNTVGLPLGMNFELMKGSALLRSEDFVSDSFDREHVTPVLKRSSVFQRDIFETGIELSHLRLTVDTPSDFLVMNIILAVARWQKLSGIALVKYVLENYSWVFEGNGEIIQKNRTTVFEDETREAINLLRKLDYFKVAEKIENEIL
jgi:spore coat polysaccharide biosynthesis protein SpsF